MQDVLGVTDTAWRSGTPVAVATVVATFRSAPRSPGAAMLVDPDGTVTGSVSGGCVEAAVYTTAQEVLADAKPQLVRYGVSDDDALAVGLSCGGMIDVFVELITARTFSALDVLVAEVASGRPVAVATVIEHPDRDRVGRHWLIRADGTTPEDGSIPEAVLTDSRRALASATNTCLSYTAAGECGGTAMRVFTESYAPRPRMVIFGAIDFAASMAHLGADLGYRVTVCDARPLFATRQRIPDAEDIVVDWPHRYLAAELASGAIDERTALVVLTHDAKFDVPLLEIALRIPTLGYVGAMGSRRTHRQRVAALRERGVSDEHLGRLRSPIGLDLGAGTPMETAVSIAAEIIAHRSGRSGASLSATSTTIHP